MKTKINQLLFFLFVFSISYVSAQQIVVEGTVKSSEDNMPVPGVNVVVKGTTRGTSTDFDGKYTISVASGETLEFSYVGFKTVDVVINNQRRLDIVLQADVAALDEVVVIGFGTQKKSDLTGAVSSIKSVELLKQPAVNAVQSIQGKLSGVNIINTNAPGSSPNVIIRGTGTAAAGTNVLYVVDGIQMRDIANINPADIETMDVLKDAASASIYGMDAANGVIIITTKKGKDGKMKISLDSYYGAKSTLNAVEMANASQYVEYFNQNRASLGLTTFLSENQPYDTDWYKALTDVGFTNSNNMALSGASDMYNYYFSFNNYNEDGILKNNEYNRNTLRSNNTIKLLDDCLKFTSNLSASFVKATPKPFSAFDGAYRQAPVIPVYYPSGQFGMPFWNQTTGIATYEGAPGEIVGSLNSIGNPVSSVFFANEKNSGTDLQGVFEGELKITDYLKATSRFAASKSFTQSRIFNDTRGRWLAADPTRTNADFDQFKANNPTSTNYTENSLSFSKYESYRYNWDSYLTFDKMFNEKHSVNAVAGITRGMRNQSTEVYMQGYDVPLQEQYWSINYTTSDYERTVRQSYSTPIKQLSYFGRLQYNFDSKYYAQVNFRRDGVSTFKNQSDQYTGTDYFGNFPSFSLGWTISKENFFADVDFIDFLKLRGGWGRLGNSEVDFNVYSFITNTGSSNVNYTFGPNQDLFLGAGLGREIKPISWEVTEETNIGFDFAMVKSKLSGAFNYYSRNTNNAILLVKPVLSSPGTEDYFDHGAEVTNKGVEIELNWKDSVSEDFSYNVGVVYSNNKNNVENVKSAYDGQIGEA